MTKTINYTLFTIQKQLELKIVLTKNNPIFKTFKLCINIQNNVKIFVNLIIQLTSIFI